MRYDTTDSTMMHNSATLDRYAPTVECNVTVKVSIECRPTYRQGIDQRSTNLNNLANESRPAIGRLADRVWAEYCPTLG